MGPVTLFDKSFLQSLTVNESFWFDRFFLINICPLFYVETLADLEKKPREGRAPEDEVRIIAEKFPDNGQPNVHHSKVSLSNLCGHPVSMDGRIQVAGGRKVRQKGKAGIHFEPSPEADAFQRWQREQFEVVERMYAKGWREEIQAVDLEETTRALKGWGIDGKKIKTLEQAAQVADDFAMKLDGLGGLKLAIRLLNLPEGSVVPAAVAWARLGKHPLGDYAPYAAFAVSIEVFFHLAIAAKLIGEEPKKHRADIAYMHYLPFCFMFVSSDGLHQRCAPFFLREDQQFVWGQDLKKDLGELEAFYSKIPEAEREKGAYAIADTPPKDRKSLVTDLWDRWMNDNWRKSDGEQGPEEPMTAEEIADIGNIAKLPGEPLGLQRNPFEEPDFMSFSRTVRIKKGSWYQLPKDINERKQDAKPHGLDGK